MPPFSTLMNQYSQAMDVNDYLQPLVRKNWTKKTHNTNSQKLSNKLSIREGKFEQTSRSSPNCPIP